MAQCTHLSYLYRKGMSESEFKELIAIFEYPDLGGEPEKIEVTTLKDTKKRYILGIQDASALTFKAYYEPEDYARLNAIQAAGSLDTYQVRFGDTTGSEGIFEWQGKLSVYVASGGTNAAREMTITISDEGEEELHFVSGGSGSFNQPASPTVQAVSGSDTLLGMSVSDLQDNIAIDSNGNVTGTLKAVTGYTGFSSDVALQDGNYFACKVTSPFDSARMKYGNKAWKNLDSDGEIVIRVSNLANDLIIETTKNGVVATTTLKFAGVTLAS